VFYISTIEKNAFQSEINDSLTHNIPISLAANDPKGSIKSALSSLPFSSLQSEYNGISEETTMYNNWLKGMMATIIGMLIIIILISGLFLSYSCSQCVSFWEIIKSNIFIFIFIGLFEGLFFYYIASKYVPAPPSLLVNRVYSDLKSW
jgi:hypothetical protein